MDKIKKVKKLYIMNWVVSILALIVSFTALFFPVLGVEFDSGEGSECIRSNCISVMDMVVGDWNADFSIKSEELGIKDGNDIVLYSVDISSELVPNDHSMAKILKNSFRLALCLGVVLMIMLAIAFYITAPKNRKEQKRLGTLDIRADFLSRFFTKPIWIFMALTDVFFLMFLIVLVILFTGSDKLYINDVVYTLFLTLNIIFEAFSIVFVQVSVKNTLAVMSEEEIASIFPNSTDYEEIISAKRMKILQEADKVDVKVLDDDMTEE